MEVNSWVSLRFGECWLNGQGALSQEVMALWALWETVDFPGGRRTRWLSNAHLTLWCCSSNPNKCWMCASYTMTTLCSIPDTSTNPFRLQVTGNRQDQKTSENSERLCFQTSLSQRHIGPCFAHSHLSTYLRQVIAYAGRVQQAAQGAKMSFLACFPN